MTGDDGLAKHRAECTSRMIDEHAPRYRALFDAGSQGKVKKLDDVRALIDWWCVVAAHLAAEPIEGTPEDIAWHAAEASAYNNVLSLLDEFISIGETQDTLDLWSEP